MKVFQIVKHLFFVSFVRYVCFMKQREFVLLRFFSLTFILFLLSFIVVLLSQRSMLFIEYLESFVSYKAA